ncbi:LysR family transcriptional regulator [Propionibacterium sp.]|uniref:LysR family transcriptional regulator n=1 Tax=Propionibacterium sp. TaxID=1977903 RepID=UPI0039ED1ADE
MDIRHLTVFVAVAQDLSFTRAAERLLLAQSAVSTTVRELERDLGVELFDRSHRQIRLTHSGDELLARSLEIIDRMRQIREVMASPGSGLRGTVTMGLMTAVTVVDVPGLLGRFHAANPEVTVQLRAAGLGSAGLVTQLDHGQIDLALLAAVDRLPATLRGEVVASSPFVLVVPESHHLAGQGSVSLAEIDGEGFIDVPLGYGSRRITDDAFARSGTTRRVLMEVAEIGTAAEYVLHGLGLALLPEFAARNAPGVALLHPVEHIPPFEVWFAVPCRRPPRRAAAALIELMRKELLPEGS